MSILTITSTLADAVFHHYTTFDIIDRLVAYAHRRAQI